MASVLFAEVSSLAAWVGQSIDASDSRATAVLTAASVLVRSHVGASVTDDWADVPDDVAQVVVQVAARVWFNPQGLVADAIDDYSRRWESGSESGVYLTAAEKDMLSSYRLKPSGLWSLTTTRDGDYADQYLDVLNPNGSTQSEPMPFLPAGE